MPRCPKVWKHTSKEKASFPSSGPTADGTTQGSPSRKVLAQQRAKEELLVHVLSARGQALAPEVPNILVSPLWHHPSSVRWARLQHQDLQPPAPRTSLGLRPLTLSCRTSLATLPKSGTGGLEEEPFPKSDNCRLTCYLGPSSSLDIVEFLSQYKGPPKLKRTQYFKVGPSIRQKPQSQPGKNSYWSHGALSLGPSLSQNTGGRKHKPGQGPEA